MTVPGSGEVELIARVRVGDRATFAAPTADGKYRVLEGTPFTRLVPTDQLLDSSTVLLLPPIVPSKIVGIGVNYPGDEATYDRRFPSMFLMPPSALIASEEPIVLPWLFGSALAEGELAVVVGRRARQLRPENAREHILGYTIANDLSGRDSSLESVPAAVKKGSDGMLPLGPHLLLSSEIRSFRIRTEVNGRVEQEGNTSEMIFGVRECLVHITSVMTLEPGDVVSLGTPPPKPRVVAGDRISVTIDGIGTLTNSVRQR